MDWYNYLGRLAGTELSLLQLKAECTLKSGKQEIMKASSKLWNE